LQGARQAVSPRGDEQSSIGAGFPIHPELRHESPIHQLDPRLSFETAPGVSR